MTNLVDKTDEELITQVRSLWDDLRAVNEQLQNRNIQVSAVVSSQYYGDAVHPIGAFNNKLQLIKDL